MRILLVEPDNLPAQAFESAARHEGMMVYRVATGGEAIDVARRYDYDAILIEMALDDMHGDEVIRTLRVAGVTTPIIVLTVVPTASDKVRALSLGADDYVVKPYNFPELVARLHAVVRRAHALTQSAVRLGNLYVDLATEDVRVGDRPVRLTRREYQLLEVLVLRRNRVVTKEVFLDQLYGGRDEPEIKIIDVFIHKLRGKLTGSTAEIETVWGRGYLLRAPQTSTQAVAA